MSNPVIKVECPSALPHYTATGSVLEGPATIQCCGSIPDNCLHPAEVPRELPEPGATLLLACGLVGLALLTRKRKR